MGIIEQPWSVPFAVDDIPETGEHIDIEAPEPDREAVAKAAGLRALPRLSARFDLSRRGGDVHVRGEVNARVRQTCVVTLDPIENEISESIDLLFAPAAARQENDTGGRAVRASSDEPEPLIGGTIDLGALATEFLMLAIDPYPRKPGAEFRPPKSGDAASRPFAALEALKKRSAGRES
ncbi:MAG TPA: DUF177 domain-containing protein [Pseudolabrys sp.]|nr:DUF177 domain-containing protein [Pseudolabrys sp.]